LECLAGRDLPSVTDPFGSIHAGDGSGASDTRHLDDANKPPVIVDFSVVEDGNGTFLITGRVSDENPGGMVVILGGSTSCRGQSVTTNEDGTFSMVVQLRVDGSDDGWITATTIDDHQQASNEPAEYVKPTPQ
jgi:hypothetical protein